jgi:membrane protease YdiL (CAAX protease family)
MRVFSHFLFAIVGTLLLTALVAGPLYLGIGGAAHDIPFPKLASRLWQLSMVGGVAWVVWRLQLRGKAAWGYGLARPQFLRQLGLGTVLGIVTMLPVAAMVSGWELRTPRPGLDVARLVELFFSGALTGMAVGFLEETFYRGLLLGALLAPLVGPSLASPSDSAQLAGARLHSNNAGSWQLAVAIVASSALFASLHFLARSKMDPAAVQWDSGLNLLQQSLRHFAHPMGMVDSFLALTAVGVLLSLARLWTGSIALSVGLHAGWVWVMKMSVGSTHLNPDAPLAVLISPIDGFTGWLVLGWTLGLTTLAWARRRPFTEWIGHQR